MNNEGQPKKIGVMEELQLNFKYFNIFWYDPNQTQDFNYFNKCFSYVQFYKGFKLESIINFFNKESSLEEWIVISPGSEGEELVSKLHEKESIRAFFIFCLNTKEHEGWIKKYEKIKCLTNDPKILIKQLIDINKDYLIPNFKYIDEKREIIDFKLDFKNLNSNNKFSLKSAKREYDELIKSINKNENKYNIFCMKTLKYLKEDKSFNEFMETLKDKNQLFYVYVENIKIEETERLKKIIKFVKNITLISLYFSKYPYLLNLFSYNEIGTLLAEDITPHNYMELYNESVYDISEELYEKLMNNTSILDEKEKLKKIQIFAILFTFFIISKYSCKDFIEFYQIINFYRDIDFCLKIFIYYIYLIFNNGNNKFRNELNAALNICDLRVENIFLSYVNSRMKNLKFTLKEEEQNNLDESLTIKDFLVIGNTILENKIKNIEKDIKINSIEYLKIDEISKYIDNKNNFDDRVTFFYYIIMDIEQFREHYNKLIILSAELGLSFIIILYIENEEKIFFNKIFLKMYIIPVVLVYSPEDLIKYLSKKTHFYLLENIKEYLKIDPKLLDFLKIKIPKINFNEINNEDYQDGCFELTDTFDNNLVKNKIIRMHTDILFDITSICNQIYLTYNEHNALDLFFKYNSRYFGFSIDPELVVLEISAIKKILYMYCREESKSKKSLYYMVNYDLRTRNPAKIFRYLDLIGILNKLLTNEELASFQGTVYRATKLDENLIVKLEPGSTMINTTFWSTSKDFNISEKFLKMNEWRNSLIICKTIKNNIDIDFENINYFGEKEVLFLPFTEFEVEKITIEKKYNRKLFTIELVELGNKNIVNIENMQVINLNNINYMQFYEEIAKGEKESEEKGDKIEKEEKSVKRENKIENKNQNNK